MSYRHSVRLNKASIQPKQLFWALQPVDHKLATASIEPNEWPDILRKGQLFSGNQENWMVT
jgi:hypothetical protein